MTADSDLHLLYQPAQKTKLPRLQVSPDGRTWLLSVLEFCSPFQLRNNQRRINMLSKPIAQDASHLVILSLTSPCQEPSTTANPESFLSYRLFHSLLCLESANAHVTFSLHCQLDQTLEPPRKPSSAWLCEGIIGEVQLRREDLPLKTRQSSRWSERGEATKEAH